MTDAPVERLNLAPKRTRPLSLWNPWDYLVLLYWAFFFPQAIRWYVETFVAEEWRNAEGRELLKALRHDGVLQTLVVQALLVTSLGLLGTARLMAEAEVSLEVSGLLIGLLCGVAVGVAKGVGGGVAFGVAKGVAVGVADGVAFGVTGCVAVGVAFGVAEGVAEGVAFDVAFDVAFGVVKGVAEGIAFGVAFGVAMPLTILRFPEWILAYSLPWRPFRLWNRMTWLPLPSLRRRLKDELSKDWDAGVHNVNEYLAYSLHFIDAIRATNDVLEEHSQDVLLNRVARLGIDPYDWGLLRFCSADLSAALWRLGRLVNLRFDTPARSACAGFWFLHDNNALGAALAFSHLSDIKHGEEVYQIAVALDNAEDATDVNAIVDMNLDWLDTLPDVELRTGTLQALRTLRSVVHETRTAENAKSSINRSAALGRASGTLQKLAENGHEFCPDPEWPLVQWIVLQWQEILIEAGGEAGEAVLREPIENPYAGYSGLPVEPPCFVGRHGVFKRIEDCWTTTDALVPIFLYGHRRMGKTSILRNLERQLGTSTLLAFIDMQDSGFVEHTGELLLDLAEAIHERVSKAGLNAGETPNAERFSNLGGGRRELNALLKRLDSELNGRRLVVAVDEFEIVEDAIAKGRIDADVVQYLRSISQRYSWLGLIFGGLHTLDEMGRDYKSAFFGQAEHVRVSYLSFDAMVDMVARPDPNFALEYADDLLEELYRLTYGQPYLLQRLCWELVNGWNQRFLEHGEKTARVLQRSELDAVLDADFFRGAAYYFEGVWKNVTEGERDALRALARREEPWTAAEASAVAGEDVLELLKRHDVVLDDGGVRFASELMRRWVAMEA